MGTINILAVVAAALSMFVIGGLWYSPLLFEKRWLRANGFTQETMRRGSPVLIYGLAFVLSLLMAANLAFFISGPDTTLAFAVGAAVAAGFGWAALGLGVIALFERRPLAYFLVNGGYLTVAFAVMGLILGLWR